MGRLLIMRLLQLAGVIAFGAGQASWLGKEGPSGCPCGLAANAGQRETIDRAMAYLVRNIKGGRWPIDWCVLSA